MKKRKDLLESRDNYLVIFSYLFYKSENLDDIGITTNEGKLRTDKDAMIRVKRNSKAGKQIMDILERVRFRKR